MIKSLSTAGTRVSIPSLVPGQRVEATTTGRLQKRPGYAQVEVMTDDATVGLWLPVDIVEVIG